MRVAINLWHVCKRVAPNYTQKGNLCTNSAIPLKKVEYKVKNQEATNSYKTCQRFISK
jgi:hypothetical protein